MGDHGASTRCCAELQGLPVRRVMRESDLLAGQELEDVVTKVVEEDVRRCRRCSSAGGYKEMPRRRWASAVSAAPVSDPLFGGTARGRW